jgi:hypothetical protein
MDFRRAFQKLKTKFPLDKQGRLKNPSFTSCGDSATNVERAGTYIKPEYPPGTANIGLPRIDARQRTYSGELSLLFKMPS